MHHARFLCPIAALALTACAAVNPAGLIAASRLDPLNTPPTDIAVAVGVPATVRLADGDVAFRMAFHAANDGSPIKLEEMVSLELSEDADGAPQPGSDGEIVYVARFAPEDAERVAALQAEIRSLKEIGVEGRGSISILVTGGCYTAKAADALFVSTWLRTGTDEEFVQLTRQTDAFEVLDPASAATLRQRLATCDEAAGT